MLSCALISNDFCLLYEQLQQSIEDLRNRLTSSRLETDSLRTELQLALVSVDAERRYRDPGLLEFKIKPWGLYIYIYIYIYTHTVPSTNISTAKAAVKIHLHCLSFIQTISSYHWSKTIESRGKSHCEINAFSCSCWPQILAPNYCNVLFPGQQLWVVSYNAWRVWRTPDKRSETVFFIQNHSRSFRFTASPLQFTSLIFYRVQVREHLTGDQRPFLHPESLQILQIHSFSSSVHSLILYRVQVRGGHSRSLVLCSATHVCFGLLSWWKIQTRSIIRFLTEAVKFWFFICWYLIESMMPCV